MEHQDSIAVFKEYRYKTVGNTTLSLFLATPKLPCPPGGYPVMVYFFGGGWVKGDPMSFQARSKVFMDAGYAVAMPDYRVVERNAIDSPVPCAMDGRSAVRWLRENALDLRLNANHMIVSGGSAGGYVALSTAVLENLNEKTDNLTVSTRPNALILYNPVTDTSAQGYQGKLLKDKPIDFTLQISPQHQLKPGLPPTLLFHGTADPTVPIENARLFAQTASANGDDCRLCEFEGAGHALLWKPDIAEKMQQAALDFLSTLQL